MKRLQLEGGAADVAFDGGTIREPGATEKKQRRHVRKRVLWCGKVDTKDGAFDCVVLNVSRSGAKLRFSAPIPRQIMINVAFGAFGMLDAQVIWQRGDKMGVCFISEPEQIASIVGQALPV